MGLLSGIGITEVIIRRFFLFFLSFVGLPACLRVACFEDSCSVVSRCLTGSAWREFLDDLKVFVSRLVVYCSMKVNVGGAFDSECANI